MIQCLSDYARGGLNISITMSQRDKSSLKLRGWPVYSLRQQSMKEPGEEDQIRFSRRLKIDYRILVKKDSK
jgi:hypothetical protein